MAEKNQYEDINLLNVMPEDRSVVPDSFEDERRHRSSVRGWGKFGDSNSDGEQHLWLVRPDGDNSESRLHSEDVVPSLSKDPEERGSQMGEAEAWAERSYNQPYFGPRVYGRSKATGQLVLIGSNDPDIMNPGNISEEDFRAQELLRTVHVEKGLLDPDKESMYYYLYKVTGIHPNTLRGMDGKDIKSLLARTRYADYPLTPQVQNILKLSQEQRRAVLDSLQQVSEAMAMAAFDYTPDGKAFNMEQKEAEEQKEAWDSKRKAMWGRAEGMVNFLENVAKGPKMDAPAGDDTLYATAGDRGNYRRIGTLGIPSQKRYVQLMLNENAAMKILHQKYGDDWQNFDDARLKA